MTKTRTPTLRHALQAAGLALFGGALAAPDLQAQLDIIPEQPILIQALQTGSTEIFAGRSTFVRVPVTLVNAVSTPVHVDGLLHVIVDGVELPDSPYFSDNGPFPAGSFGSLGAEDFTLNFIIVPPESDDVVLQVEINPPGPSFVAEANTANNVVTTPSFEIGRLNTVTMAYAPIDYRPSGGPTPNPPDSDLIKPGVGDNFVQGVYPGGRIEYRRIDTPTKLWTQSVAGTGSTLNNSLAGDLALMSPQPNFIYGWIPGSIPYNGQALLPGVASMGNTQPIRHQRTYAHELGHNTNLFHNGSQAGEVGVDVERHLNITESLPRIKAPTLNDIMVAGQLTNTAWITNSSYQNSINHFAWDPGTDTDTDAAPEGEGARLIVSGMWNRETGEISMDPIVEVNSGRLTPAGLAGSRDLVLSGSVRGETARELPLTVRTSLDECEACRNTAGLEADTDSNGFAHPLVGFVAVIPATNAAGERLDQLSIAGLGTHPAQSLTITRSESVPTVAFRTQASEMLVGDNLHLAWQGSDDDGDELSYVLRYVPDGDAHMVPLLNNSSATSFDVDFSRLPQFVAGKGYFELLATDGLNTTRTRTEPLQGNGAYAGGGGNAPFVEIYHPDNGFRFKQGANIVLHSSGWDLEDFALEGESIQWTSDVDGALGSGRRFTINSLTPGVHQITVTATDSGGLMSSRTHAVVVSARDLPDVDRVVCSSDIGFGGPGNAQLSLCGGDLTAGGSAELLLSGAAPNSMAFLAIGLTANPTPLKGGTFVPLPYATLMPGLTDVNGEISTPNVMSVGGPLAFYVQYVIADGSQAAGYDFSNAVFVEF
ncbi:MAG: hypothetical protein DHS20C15_12790 [Planctomycetota bacterium]|nr:MAG: hypothetical protein DHS20C15_12790 [Planctomycetota bacterium]